SDRFERLISPAVCILSLVVPINVEVVVQSEVQRQARCDLPVVLNVGAELLLPLSVSPPRRPTEHDIPYSNGAHRAGGKEALRVFGLVAHDNGWNIKEICRSLANPTCTGQRDSNTRIESKIAPNLQGMFAQLVGE